MRRYCKWVLVGLAFYCCRAKPTPVVIGLDGREFVEPTRSAEQQQALEANLATAKAAFQSDPSEENYIWYGRREGYLLHLTQAIDIYTEGLSKFPSSYKLLRHRGHRYISLRQFDKAIADLEKASQLMVGKPTEVEPDGAPNKLNIPLTTTQSNVWYHLGLAYYLKGEYTQAARAYEECFRLSENDDGLVSSIDWLYMTYQRLGRKQDAEKLVEQVQSDMNIVENDSYHKRLLMYKGQYQPEELLTAEANETDFSVTIATQGYGVGNWYLLQGDTTKALQTFEQVVQGTSFAAFGFIAAEADLQRLRATRQ
jgi:tetratricopeptide (TPR) repeat protein